VPENLEKVIEAWNEMVDPGSDPSGFTAGDT
jgi:hypothetical protein